MKSKALSILLSNVTVPPLHMLLISFICKLFLSTLERKLVSPRSPGTHAPPFNRFREQPHCGEIFFFFFFFWNPFNVSVQAFNAFHQTITCNWSHKTHRSFVWSQTLEIYMLWHSLNAFVKNHSKHICTKTQTAVSLVSLVTVWRLTSGGGDRECRIGEQECVHNQNSLSHFWGEGFCKTLQGRESGKAIYLLGTHKHHKLCWLTTMNFFLEESQLKISTLTSKRVQKARSPPPSKEINISQKLASVSTPSPVFHRLNPPKGNTSLFLQLRIYRGTEYKFFGVWLPKLTGCLWELSTDVVSSFPWYFVTPLQVNSTTMGSFTTSV